MSVVAMRGIPPAGTYLSPRNADKVVSLALALQLWLKYGKRGIRDLPTVADLRAEPSRALDTRGSVTSELCFVVDKGTRYRWDRNATVADDGDSVIKPTDVALDQGGRWLKAPFRDFDRKFYLQSIWLIDEGIPFRSPVDEEGHAVGPSLLQVCAGKLPAVFLCFAGKDQMQEASQIPIAQRLQHLLFNVKVIAGNWRGATAARFGSPDATEAPELSASEIVGDIDHYLSAHPNLGGVPGLGRFKIGAHRPGGGFGLDHLVMDILQVRALCTIEVPNEPHDLVRPELFLVQMRQVIQDDPFQTQDIGDPLQARKG